MSLQNKKDFSIMKWLIFPFIALILAIGIGISNVMMFGFMGSILYLGMLLAIFVISLVMVFQTGNKRLPQAIICAFSFETAGLIALLATCITAIVFVRQIQGVKEYNNNTKETVAEISKLKSASAQRNVTKNIALEVKDVGKAYERAESVLLWTLSFEAAVYFLGLMALFGINLFCKPPNEQDDELLHNKTSGVKMKVVTAPLATKSVRYKSISNGKESFRLRTLRGNSTSVQVSWRGGGQEIFCMTITDAQADAMQHRDYFDVGAEVVKYMKKAGMNYQPIEATL